ncbi:MAG: helix-turn-helix transcriptional regulator [Actinobacteria bacterium]|nr:helix-turn-helix transcriptional regulator [Actinomycetota bacterium]
MSLALMGRDLRARRRALGLTQVALAEAVGTRPVMVGRWERGEALPSADEVMRLAEALELDPAVAAAWGGVARRPPAMPAPPPAESGAGPRWAGLRQAISLFSARWGVRRRPWGSIPGDAGDGAVFPSPGVPRLGESYLDDPMERRRYTLRWVLTLLVLGALAVGLVWALGELHQGWGAFLDLFRGRPPSTGLTRALGWPVAG